MEGIAGAEGGRWVSRSRAGPDPLALAFRERQSARECFRDLCHLVSAPVCLWVPLFCVLLTQWDKPLLFSALWWVLLFGQEVRQLLLPCLDVIMAKGSSCPCIFSLFSICSTALFTEQEMVHLTVSCVPQRLQADAQRGERLKKAPHVPAFYAFSAQWLQGFLFPSPIESDMEPADLPAHTSPCWTELQRSHVCKNFLLPLPEPSTKQLHWAAWDPSVGRDTQ